MSVHRTWVIFTHQMYDNISHEGSPRVKGVLPTIGGPIMGSAFPPFVKTIF